MKNSIFFRRAPHLEPSELTAFSRNVLARDSEHRDETSLETALKVEGTHCLAFSGTQLVLKHDGSVLDPLFAPYELAELGADFDHAILLGHQANGEPRLAVPVSVAPDALAAEFKPADPRALFRDALVGEDVLGEVAQALSLLRWNADNKFCGRCGGVMEGRIGGYKRICCACGHEIFPRTDPVAIMLVVDEVRDLCLLGRSPRFPDGMYSSLAGFVEPGETIENAVRRETLEESGIAIGRVRYHASQPWPMPHQLMIGCYAEATSFDIEFDQTELADCRWFNRDEIGRMLTTGPVDGRTLPIEGTIARRLIEDWFDWQH
ncbi:NAD(+) diphosphatase [Peteryoungia ipomoeae]|uniref:NAD(+) diphosphatase n=1 Tax=Peteryoungia ipomoeae TaxID=1210932 RepID=A0A4S8P5B0_9HYPH|nr:NAD(+) diphosphatase [Peteryoungia ipomoeae]THV24112.1 NAD(+) diphosphatase [Peteryoungia ipomoeae]